MMDTGAVQTTMQVIGGKWKAGALMQLKAGPTRFNALKRRLPGVTQRMLSQQLRELEADGIVSRKVLEVVPPHVEYALTPRGATLVPILNWLAEWGAAHGSAQPCTAAAEASAKNGGAAPLADPVELRIVPLQGVPLTDGGTRLAFGAASLTEADG